MNQYVADTKYAVEVLIKTINKEESERNNLLAEQAALKEAYDKLLADTSTEETHQYFSDYQVEERYNRIDEFDKENKTNGKRKKFKELQKAVMDKEDLINILSIALLQIAKKGVAIALKKSTGTPEGRKFGQESLKNVILYGTHQAIFCDDKYADSETSKCFENLTQAFGHSFDISADGSKSKANKIIKLLDWRSYQNYKNDLISLIG